MRPPIAYYGAKVNVAERIAALLPTHEHYVEPYGGSLAVLLAKRPSRMETVNDLDAELMAFWQTLRDRPADLERVCALTPHSRAEYTAAYEPVPADHADRKLEQARRVWVRLTQGRAGTLRTTGWRHYIHPDDRTSSMPRRISSYVGRIAAAAERLAHVTLECHPALEVIDAYGQHPGALLYVDPPYLSSTRTSTQYRYEVSTGEEHRELAEALRAARAAVVLSGYPSDLYDHELYPDWHRTEIPSHTSQGGTGSARTEVLWSNRPPRGAEYLFEMQAT